MLARNYDGQCVQNGPRPQILTEIMLQPRCSAMTRLGESRFSLLNPFSYQRNNIQIIRYFNQDIKWETIIYEKTGVLPGCTISRIKYTRLEKPSPLTVTRGLYFVSLRLCFQKLVARVGLAPTLFLCVADLQSAPFATTGIWQ